MSKEPTKDYKITVDFGSSTATGFGGTAYEALSNVKRPVKITSKVFLTLTHGKKKAEQWYLPQRAKRLFYPNAQLILAKQLELLLR